MTLATPERITAKVGIETIEVTCISKFRVRRRISSARKLHALLAALPEAITEGNAGTAWLVGFLRGDFSNIFEIPFPFIAFSVYDHVRVEEDVVRGA